MSKKNIKYLLASLAALSSSSGIAFAGEQQSLAYQQFPAGYFNTGYPYGPQMPNVQTIYQQYAQQMGQYPQQMNQQYVPQMGQYPQQMNQQYVQQTGQYPQQMNPQSLSQAGPKNKTNDVKQSGIKEAALNGKESVQQKQAVKTSSPAAQLKTVPVLPAPTKKVPRTNSKKVSILKPLAMTTVFVVGGAAAYMAYRYYQSKETPLSPAERIRENINLAAQIIWESVKDWLEHNPDYLDAYNARPNVITEERLKLLVKTWVNSYIANENNLDELGYADWLGTLEDDEEKRSAFFYEMVKKNVHSLNQVDSDLGMIFASSRDWLKKECYNDDNYFDPKKSPTLDDEDGLLMSDGGAKLRIWLNLNRKDVTLLWGTDE